MPYVRGVIFNVKIVSSCQIVELSMQKIDISVCKKVNLSFGLFLQPTFC